jgi:Mce-associated membrane protein
MTTKLKDDRDLDHNADDELSDEVEEIEDDDAEVDPPDEEDAPGWRSRFLDPRRLTVLLAAVSVLLVAAGTWAMVAAGNLRDSPASRNEALVDTGRTAEVSAAVTSALNQIFSYSYDKTGVTEQAAKDVLRGDALVTYDKLFAEVRTKAPEQKLVLTSRVVYSAVQSLEGDRAMLLVFLDQSATRVDTDTTSGAAAQLSITAQREGERWVITDMAPR